MSKDRLQENIIEIAGVTKCYGSVVGACSIVPISILNPFHYYCAADILLEGHVRATDLLMLIAMSIVLLFVAQFIFERRDVPT